MAKENTMYQCLLEKDNRRMIGWIEERAAKINYFVESLEFGGFWQVKIVYGCMSKTQLAEKNANDRDCFGSLRGNND